MIDALRSNNIFAMDPELKEIWDNEEDDLWDNLQAKRNSAWPVSF